MAVYCSQCGTKNDDNAGKCESCNATIARVIPNSGAGSDSASSRSGKYDLSPANLAIAGVCLLYLVFPTLGIFELIPDAVPIIGSLDEAAATTGLLLALSRIGIIPFGKTSTWT